MIPVSARNIEFVGHTGQNGRGDGVQVMVHRSTLLSGTCSAMALRSPTSAIPAGPAR
jgi:hypothetical protein